MSEEVRHIRIACSEEDARFINGWDEDAYSLCGLVVEAFETNQLMLLSPLIRNMILEHAKKVKAKRDKFAGHSLYVDNLGLSLAKK